MELTLVKVCLLFEYYVVIWSLWISVGSRITLLLLAHVKGANIISVLKNFSLFFIHRCVKYPSLLVQKKSPVCSLVC